MTVFVRMLIERPRMYYIDYDMLFLFSYLFLFSLFLVKNSIKIIFEKKKEK